MGKKRSVPKLVDNSKIKGLKQPKFCKKPSIVDDSNVAISCQRDNVTGHSGQPFAANDYFAEVEELHYVEELRDVAKEQSCITEGFKNTSDEQTQTVVTLEKCTPKRNNNRTSRRLLDPELKRKGQEKNTAQKRRARMDPKYRKREQERNTLSKRNARKNPEYKKKEQERNTESKRRARMNPDYRKKEQNRQKFVQQMAKLGLNPDGSIKVDGCRIKMCKRVELNTRRGELNASATLISVPGINLPILVGMTRDIAVAGNTETLMTNHERELQSPPEIILGSNSPIHYEQNSHSSSCNEEIQNIGLGANFNESIIPNVIAYKSVDYVQKLPSVMGEIMQVNTHIPMMQLSTNEDNDSNEEVVYLRI